MREIGVAMNIRSRRDSARACNGNVPREVREGRKDDRSLSELGGLGVRQTCPVPRAAPPVASVRRRGAGKLRHAPQPLDEASTLLVSPVERAVRAPTDQVITTISLEIAQSSHAAHSSIFRNYSTTPTPPLVSDPHPLLVSDPHPLLTHSLTHSHSVLRR